MKSTAVSFLALVASPLLVSCAEAETGIPQPTDPEPDASGTVDLLIQAECALNVSSYECLGVKGLSSDLNDEHGWGQRYPSLSEDGQVGYTNGDSWLAFENINLTNCNAITLRYTCGDTQAEGQNVGFYVRLDSPEGEDIAFLKTGYTGSWDTYLDTTAVPSDSITGEHTVYFVAAVRGVNNGNVDSIKFSYDAPAVPTDGVPTDGGPTDGGPTDTDGREEGGLYIEAECALDGSTSACASVTGSNSALPDVHNWGSAYPSITDDGQVGYTAGGSWIAFEAIDLTEFTQVTIHYACAEGEGETPEIGYSVRLDSPEGTEVGILNTAFTGGWQVYADATAALSAEATGIHTVYFVANLDQRNNGNLDWIRFHN